MKSTTETDQILASKTLNDLNQYLTGDYINEYASLSDYLNEYIARHQLVLADIVKDSHLNRNYAYHILNGTKPNPRRDKLIPLCLAMHMNLEETNRALKISKAGTLYSKDKHDSIIIMCINEQVFDVLKVNEYLYSNGCETLGDIK